MRRTLLALSPRPAMARRAIALGVIAVLVSLAAASSTPQPARLELLPEPPRPISPLAVGGFNLGNWMPVVEFRDALLGARPTVVRFPGGNIGDEQNLTADGMVTLRTNLGLLRGPALVLQTRVFALRPGSKNQPQDAAGAARDAKGLGLKVAYWEIGNEPDLYATNRGDPTWTPERYCQTFRAQRAAILGVDPAAKFAGPAVSNPGPFLERFLALCGDVVDLLTWHVYPSRGELSDEAALASAARVSEVLERYKTLVASPEANPLGHRRAIELGVTEYGLSWYTRNTRHLADQVGALWAAEATLRLATGGARLATYFALQATGGHGLVDEAGVPRPTLYAFRELARFRGEAVPVRASDPALWVHAARDGDRLTVIAMNPSTSPSSLEPALPGWTPLGAKGFTAAVVDAEAEPTRFPLEALTLPARSFARIAYKRPPAAR